MAKKSGGPRQGSRRGCLYPGASLRTHCASLLEETNEFRLARWLTNRFGADWKFLAHFYRTGEKVRFETEAGAGEPLLVSVPIPRFIPNDGPHEARSETASPPRKV
jgi:hypothetical protein